MKQNLVTGMTMNSSFTVCSLKKNVQPFKPLFLFVRNKYYFVDFLSLY